MKTTINREALTKAVQVVSRAVEKKSTMPVLGHIRLQMEGKAGSVTGTDLETSIIYPIEGNCAKKLDILLPANRFLGILRDAQNFEKEANIEPTEDNRAIVSHATLCTLPSGEFPTLPVPEEDSQHFELEGLEEAMSKVIEAAGESDSRYVLNALYFDFPGKRIVATDGHRLHLVKYPFPDAEFLLLVPKKSIPLLKGEKIKVTISKKDQRVMGFFDNGQYTLIVRFLEGTYPNVDNVIPKEKGAIQFTVHKQALLGLCIENLPINADRSNASRFIVKPGSLTIETINPGVAENKASINAKLTGDTDFACGFNLAFVIDVLKVLEGTEVTFKMHDSLSPCKIEEDGFLALIMPMRI